MKGVTNYLKNITKSVAYATADVVKQDLMPNVDSFASSNKEFMVNTYSAVRNPKASAKKTINAFKESKITEQETYLKTYVLVIFIIKKDMKEMRVSLVHGEILMIFQNLI